MSDTTVPVKKAGLPVKRLRVSVRSGPDAGRQVEGEARISVGTADGNVLLLTDRAVSRFHLDLERSLEGISVVDRGSTNGTEIAGVRLRDAEVSVRPGSVIRLGETELVLDDGDVTLIDHGPSRLGGLLARSALMRRLMASVQRVAESEVPVLVLGESGTGKELIGHALHDSSRRADAPFVVVDCGSLSPTLFASELFGHERGAFTGAVKQRAGAFERARGGTLFLDEIGELPFELQAVLLGVLERRTFRRVGGDSELAVDVRVLSATSRDLRHEVNRGSFRLDLFYRLAVVLLDVPPLRKRPEDIPDLVAHFLAEAGHAGSVSEIFSEAALERLEQHGWPGNVRELRNVVLGTLALGKPQPIGANAPASAVPFDLNPFFDQLPLSYRAARQTVTDAFERRYLERLLLRAEDNVREASRLGQINRSYLIELLKRHGIR